MLVGLFKAHHVHEAFEPLCSAHFKKPVAIFHVFVSENRRLGPLRSSPSSLNFNHWNIKSIPFHVNVSNCPTRYLLISQCEVKVWEKHSRRNSFLNKVVPGAPVQRMASKCEQYYKYYCRKESCCVQALCDFLSRGLNLLCTTSGWVGK